MKRPRGSLGLEALNSSFPTGAPGNFDSGVQGEWESGKGCLFGISTGIE